MALEDNLLCLVPIAVLLCRLQVGTMVTIEILKDAILILETSKVRSLRRRCILNGCEPSMLLLAM